MKHPRHFSTCFSPNLLRYAIHANKIVFYTTTPSAKPIPTTIRTSTTIMTTTTKAGTTALGNSAMYQTNNIDQKGTNIETLLKRGQTSTLASSITFTPITSK